MNTDKAHAELLEEVQKLKTLWDASQASGTVLQRLTLVTMRNKFSACAAMARRLLEEAKAEGPVDFLIELLITVGVAAAAAADEDVAAIQKKIRAGEYKTEERDTTGNWLSIWHPNSGNVTTSDYSDGTMIEVVDDDNNTRAMPVHLARAGLSHLKAAGFQSWRPFLGEKMAYRPDVMPEGEEWRPFLPHVPIVATCQFGRGRFRGPLGVRFFSQAKEAFDNPDLFISSARLATLAEMDRKQDKTEEVKTKSVKREAGRTAPRPWSDYTKMLQEAEAEEAEEQRTKTVKRSALYPNSLIFETLREDEEDDRFSQTELLWRPRSACVEGMEWIPWKLNDETVWVLHSDGTLACGTADLFKWSWREKLSWDPDYSNIIACWRFTD